MSITAGVFGLIGVVVGSLAALGGQWLIEAQRESNERRKHRAAKLEEFVATIYDHKHWLEAVRKARLFGGSEPEIVSPFARLEAVAIVYFPEIMPQLYAFEVAANKYQLWMINKERDSLITGEVSIDGFNAVFEPYQAALQNVLSQARMIARRLTKERQESVGSVDSR